MKKYKQRQKTKAFVKKFSSTPEMMAVKRKIYEQTEMDPYDVCEFEHLSDEEFLKTVYKETPWPRRMRRRFDFWLEQKRKAIRKYFTGPTGYTGPAGMMGHDGKPGAPGRHACEIMCPHCSTWNSEVNDGTQENKSESKWHIPSLLPEHENEPFGTWHCGRCGENSEWFIGAPVLIPANEVVRRVVEPKQNNI